MKQLLKLTKTDPAAFATLLQETITTLETYRHDALKALQAGDKETFTSLTQKIKMPVAMLRATNLQKMLENASRLMLEEDLSKDEFQSISEQLDDELETLLTALKKAV